MSNKRWDYESLKKEALKYKKRDEFNRKSNAAYCAAQRRGILNKICAHMKQRKLDYAACLVEGLKHRSKDDFKKKSGGAYDAAWRNGWLESIFEKMGVNKESYSKSKERCWEESIKFKTRNEFYNKAAGAYDAARKNSWLDEICSHMPKIAPQPHFKWNFETTKAEAAKYTNKKDFRDNAPHGYSTAKKHNWLEKITEHMVPIGNITKRLIYRAIFSDGCAYVGLTYNIDVRKNQHLKERGTVYNYVQESGLIPKFEILTKYLNLNEAQEMEKYWKIKTEEEGFKILNIAKTGGLGGGIIKWTYEKILEFTLSCKTRSDFYKNTGAYLSAKKNGWLGEFLKNLKYENKPSNYWNIQRCKVCAKNCKSKSEFKRRYPSAYTKAGMKGWIDDICSHMESSNKKNGYWSSKKNCKKHASECKSRNEFGIKYSRGYSISLKNKWIDEFFPK